MRTHILIAGVILLIIGIGVAYHFLTRPTPGAETFREEFNLTLQSYDGTDVPLSEFRRSIIVAHTWASWCPYCGDELKNLAELKREFGDSITVLAVNRAESLEEARAFTDPLDLSGVEILLDPDDAFFRSIGGYAMPETVFIDSNSEVIFHQRGPIQMDEVRARIQELTQ
jgi:thiol-disulfide isomerase/thioredoxin